MDQYDRVGWRGEPITRRQRQALIVVENFIQKEHPRWNFEFTVPQGSWQHQTDYSGTSHTGAAVVDLQYAGFYGTYGYNTRAEKLKARFILRALRDIGHQAALMRGKLDGMVNHYHVMDLDTRGAAETVRFFQVPQYRLGYNALDYQVKDRYPYRRSPQTKWRFKD
jgi:hypothetical protein